MIYLDYNSTTPLDEKVKEVFIHQIKTGFANPSSFYRLSQKEKAKIEYARDVVSSFLGVREGQIIFTSGGTEANNLAIKGVVFAHKNKNKHIITSRIEHPSVLNVFSCLQEEGVRVSFLNCDRDGLVDPNELISLINKDTILVSVMHANNETGVIQPLEEISRICRERNIVFHSDAVQTVGKIPVNVEKLGVDLLSFSAHKFYGPAGAGALFIRKNIEITPLFSGGAQEFGLRPGTENTPAIVGLAEAIKVAEEKLSLDKTKIKPLRDKLEKELLKRIEGAKVNGHLKKRLYNTLNISFPGIDQQSLLILLDREGIFASARSACASGSLSPSYVLKAMGRNDKEASSSLRFSLGRYTTEEEIDKAIEIIFSCVKKIRKNIGF